MWFKALYLKVFLKFEFKKTATQTPIEIFGQGLNDVFLLHLTVRLCTVFDVSHVVLKKNIVILLSAALTKSNYI